MRKKLYFKLILCGCLICLVFTIRYCAKEEIVNAEIQPTITPTITVIPTDPPVPTMVPTSTPTPTVTPSPTVSPIPTPTATPELTPVIDEDLETFSSEKPSLYDTYSEKELELLFRVVEAETRGGDVESKSHVASVIFNRLKAGWWGGNLTKNLMGKNQFAVVTSGIYKKVTITNSTILACEIAFENDTAQGALFFDSTDGKSWAHKNRTFLFRDKIGHNFYE